MEPAAGTAWSAHAHAVLVGAGHRRGGARTAIIELFAHKACALTALEVEDELRADGRAVARASVYRVLELLHAHGLVARLDLGPGMARYETVDPAGEHHHHLVCRRCGRLVPFENEELERSIVALGSRAGFEVTDHDVVLRGYCDRCAGGRGAGPLGPSDKN